MRPVALGPARQRSLEQMGVLVQRNRCDIKHLGDGRKRPFRCNQRLAALDDGRVLQSDSSSTAEAANSTMMGANVDSIETRWAKFAHQVSGEWDGVSATFDVDGTPRELPEYYVPQAYRDWEVKLYDWQTQCSMNCDSNSMSYSLRKLMPTVGCEADAIAFTEDASDGFEFSSPEFVFSGAGLSTASVGDGILDENKFDCKAEHIMTQKKGYRTRVVHLFKRMGAERQWQLQGVEVHIEKRDGPFSGKRELSGCGGGMNPFATSNALDISELESKQWLADGIIVSQGEGLKTVTWQPWSFPSSGVPVLGLPMDVWTSCSLQHADDNSKLHLKICTGVMDPRNGTMRIVCQESEGGSLLSASLLTASACS
eukprot:jgi/Picsp_1/234/NSC_00233-R1_protein